MLIPLNITFFNALSIGSGLVAAVGLVVACSVIFLTFDSVI